MLNPCRSAIFAAAAVGIGLLVGPVGAQPPGRGGPPGGFGGGSGLEMLFAPDVRNEIELVEEQEDQLRELSDRMRDNMRSVFEGIRDLPPEERRESIMSRMSEQQAQTEKELQSILLDHQIERLKQLQLQTRLQRGSAADALASDDLRDALGLSDAQLEQMRKLATDTEQELREKIRAATEEARNKILVILTPDQRAKWDEMMGAPFQFTEEERFGRRRFGGGGPPGRGFRGGPGGGGPPRR